MKKNAKNYGNIEGQWTNFLSYDNVKYWEKEEFALAHYYKSKFILPSDSMNREDLNLFIKNDENESQNCKYQRD